MPWRTITVVVADQHADHASCVSERHHQRAPHARAPAALRDGRAGRRSAPRVRACPSRRSCARRRSASGAAPTPSSRTSRCSTGSGGASTSMRIRTSAGLRMARRRCCSISWKMRNTAIATPPSGSRARPAVTCISQLGAAARRVCSELAAPAIRARPTGPGGRGCSGRRSVMMRPTLSTAVSISRAHAGMRTWLAQLARLGAGCADALVEPVHVHLQRHQQRAELVVDFAGDARALVLAHRLEVGRQLAQLRRAPRQFARCARPPAARARRSPAAAASVGALALGDVDEGDDRAAHHAVVDDRVDEYSAAKALPSARHSTSLSMRHGRPRRKALKIGQSASG